MFKNKVCKECGKEFTPRNGSQVYCSGPHFAICKYCGKSFSYLCSPREKPTYCSSKCVTLGKQVTVMHRYGVKNVSELQAVKDKISKANSSEEVSARRKEMCLTKYGVDNVSKAPEVRKKLSEVMKTAEYLSSREATCLEKYGAASPMQTDEVKLRREQTCLARYGMTGHPHSEEDFRKMMLDGTKVTEYLQFRADPRSYIETKFEDKPSISQLEECLGVTNTPIYDILVKYDCRDIITHSFSTMEDEVVSYLYSIDPSLNILRNDRTVISPQEIDIYLPDYKLGIECNPAATHNSSAKDPWGQEPKFYKYHQIKSFQCEEKGIFLFHIFGYEWVNNRSIIESMLRNLLSMNENRLGARETYVTKISSAECRDFLNNNHRQKFTTASVMLGLKTIADDKLVSVMTFGHLRPTMGRSSDSDSSIWELSRFCNLCNCTVSGAASKLFKFFIDTYSPKQVISFSDIAHTKGSLYSVLGFTKDSVTSPGYVWTDLYDNKYYNRVSCQKRNLKKLFNDNSIDTENQSEKEIMEAHKFVRVYDSGLIKWVRTF